MVARITMRWMLGSLAVLCVIFVLGMEYGLDQGIHDWIHGYASLWQRSSFMPWHCVFYQGPKVVLAGCLCYWLAMALRGRAGYAYALAYALILILSVPALKWWTNTACPWDYQRYGGHLIPETWFAHGVSTRYECFPAGHATVGFALLGWCFVWPPRRSQVAWYAFFAWGWCLGGYQMLRGAHYWSHTATTAWMAYVLMWLLMSLRSWRKASRSIGAQAHTT